jgi:hypothetical protein
VNIGVAVAATGVDGYGAYKDYKNGNYVGGAIETIHTITDACGVIPEVGDAISLAGDLGTAGLHWLTGR